MNFSTTDSNLYYQTIPMFLEYAPRILAMAEITEKAERQSSTLSLRLTPDTFTAGEHLVIAQGFILRTIFPLMGRDCPELSTDEATNKGISQRHSELMDIVRNISPDDFYGAASRQISHVAGDATLTQSAHDYLQLFGIPNFFFHLTLGYATLKANGVELGKGDFDGLHEYARGFSFQE